MCFFQEFVVDFLFVFCKENVNRFIKYIGYGNVVGFLVLRGFMGNVQFQSSGDYFLDDEDFEIEEYVMDKLYIDLMIGEENFIGIFCLQ